MYHYNPSFVDSVWLVLYISQNNKFLLLWIRIYLFLSKLDNTIQFAGFFTGLSIFKAQKYFVMLVGEVSWQIILFGSLSIPVYELFNLIFQYRQAWNFHPVVKKLKLFKNEHHNSWISVCNEINNEYKQ